MHHLATTITTRCAVVASTSSSSSSSSRGGRQNATRAQFSARHRYQQQHQRRQQQRVTISLDNETSSRKNNGRLFASSFVVKASSSSSEGEDGNDDTATPSSSSAPSAGNGFDGFDTGTSVTDEDQERLKMMSQEIKDWLKLLYVKREMSFNEVKLIIGIEDPRLADRRERFGIEDESGCSAEEKIQVLEDVDEGRIPTDIVACEFVLNELREWPGLDSDTVAPERRETGPSRYEEIAMDAAGIKGRTRNPKRMLDDYLDEDEEDDKKQNILGFLPLYAVSSAPIFITIFALGIMFVNSLQ